jgi:hypothetical protein
VDSHTHAHDGTAILSNVVKAVTELVRITDHFYEVDSTSPCHECVRSGG